LDSSQLFSTLLNFSQLVFHLFPHFLSPLPKSSRPFLNFSHVFPDFFSPRVTSS
jgi:hypothetical protein